MRQDAAKACFMSAQTAPPPPPPEQPSKEILKFDNEGNREQWKWKAKQLSKITPINVYRAIHLNGRII
jgi:hypothetical protein